MNEFLGEKCHVKVEKEWYEAIYIGVFQRSDVVGASPMIGGHPGGVVAYPVAVVRIDGGLREFRLSNIEF